MLAIFIFVLKLVFETDGFNWTQKSSIRLKNFAEHAPAIKFEVRISEIECGRLRKRWVKGACLFLFLTDYFDTLIFFILVKLNQLVF